MTANNTWDRLPILDFLSLIAQNLQPHKEAEPHSHIIRQRRAFYKQWLWEENERALPNKESALIYKVLAKWQKSSTVSLWYSVCISAATNTNTRYNLFVIRLSAPTRKRCSSQTQKHLECARDESLISPRWRCEWLREFGVRPNLIY